MIITSKAIFPFFQPLTFPACIASGVKTLVYTSTYNVVFGGQEIRNGNESLPYFPVDKVRNELAIIQSENTSLYMYNI